MAFDVSSLSNYTDEQRLELLYRSLYDGATLSWLKGNGQMIPGIKSAKALPIVESTMYRQADGCGFTSSGTTAISQRVITVKGYQFQEALCPTTLETKFTQLGLPPGHPETLGKFQMKIGEEKMATVADDNEIKMWQGDASNTGEWDGFKTLLDDLGFGGAGDPVQANVTGGGFTQLTTSDGITSANILSIVTQQWKKIPARVRSKNDVYTFCGVDFFDMAIQAARDANWFHFDPNSLMTGRETRWPGTNMILKAVPGLNATDVLISARKNNMFGGTDLTGEEDTFDIWWSKDNREVRFVTTAKLGAQYAFPGEVTYFKLVAP